MIEGIKTLVFVVVVAAALICGIDAVYNDSKWMSIALQFIYVPDLPRIFASL